MLVSSLIGRMQLPALHARFDDLLPAVQSESQVAFGKLRSAEDREDAAADATLAAWKRFLRAAASSTSIDPADLARRAVASVVRRLRYRSRLAI